jgi:hypothetical protein
MNDDRLNLDALDPTRDAAFEQRVSAIAADAMRARRVRSASARSDVFAELAAWMRPALAAAVLIAIVSAAALVREARLASPDAATPRGASAAEILGIPQSLIALTRSSEPASVTQLAAAVGLSDQGGGRGR